MRTKFPSLGYVKPYPEQLPAINTGVESDAKRILFASPTGTGKSIVELKSHEKTFPKSWCITPRIEILAGFLDKLNVSYSSLEDLVRKGWELHLTTPLRLRNALIAGELSELPEILYIDEGHHESAESYQQLIACLPNETRLRAYTATPFRGTPKQTSEFLDIWGTPYEIMTYRQAIDGGYMTFPHCETWGLINDDLLEIGSNGEFVISRLTAAVNNNIEHALQLAKDYGFFLPNGQPKRPTLITVPSSNCFPLMEQLRKSMKIHMVFMSDETSWQDRFVYLQGARKCYWSLVHINTVSEGVDLPFRQHLDLSPTFSPVMFTQRFGRTTRPVDRREDIPIYICTNRNLERHGYIFGGVMPPSVLTQSQKVFEGPTERISTRVFGLKSLGKLHGFRIKLSNGLQVTCYNITQMEGIKKHEYFVLAHPVYDKPLFFKKESTKVDTAIGERQQYDWGTWKLLDTPPENLSGFKSHPARSLSDKQINLWKRHAAPRGIDPEQKLDTRTFQILPVLLNSGATLADG